MVMSPIEEQLSAQFYAWESRGRGCEVYPTPVVLEPTFVPFYGYSLPKPAIVDDGRRPTFLSSLVKRLFDHTPPPEPEPEPEVESLPDELSREPVVELAVFFPATAHFKVDALQAFLTSLPSLTEPLAFEVFGNGERVVMQFATSPHDLGRVKPLLAAHFPTATFQSQTRPLASLWMEEQAVVEFGLGREFMLPLATGIPDPLVALSGALHALAEDEVGIYQILFQPVRHSWEDSIVRAVTHADGKPFFVNAPELVRAAERKISRSLFSVVVRLATSAGSIDRAWAIAANLSGALRLFQNPQGNELVPLSNEEYPYEEHAADVVRRQSRRCGMLLNVEELSGFVHLPSIPLPVFSKGVRPSHPAPRQSPAVGGLILGNNDHLGESIPVILSPEQRFRHVHILGTTGTGKSTLLFNLIRQDIENGEGIAVLDPHGDLIDRILGIIPENRQNDVIVFDPSDPEFTVGFNLLSAHSEAEKSLLASDLVSVFERHSTSWGDQMNSVLRNAVMAFLESSRGGTLLDLRRFLLEQDFRSEFLTTVTDSEVLYYWQKAFGQLTGTKSLGPILTRLDTFLSPKPIRHALAMQHGKLNFGNVMDGGKIFLAKLPQGQIGKENSFLLGSLLVGKFQQLAMARQGLNESQRRPFHLVIDEFHQFMTPSMAEILNGARKYRLGLTLAHQELRQLAADKDVESALLANAGTRVIFRVGDADAKQLAEGFAHFEAGDISKLEKGQALCRIDRSDHDFNLSVTPSTTSAEADETRVTVLTRSRKQFATPRAEIETLLRSQLAVTPKPEKAKPTKPEPPIPVPHSAAPVSAEALPPVIAEVPPVVPAEVRQEPIAESKPVITAKTTNVSTGSGEEKAPASLGRGGAEHKSIQKRLKDAAGKLGYLVTQEKPVLDRAGSVDLALESTNRNIAVEIAVTTTIDHEVGNVLKCLKAGFQSVAVISGSEAKLSQMQQAVTAALGSAEAVNIGYFTPDQFIEHLQALAKTDTHVAAPAATIRRGRKVTRSAPKLTPEEMKQAEASGTKAIADLMKQKK